MSFFKFLNPFNWFKKEELDSLDNYDYAVVRLTDNAINNGIDDNFNKIIVRKRYGVSEKPIDFTFEEARALKEVEEIPIIDEELEEEFDFEQEEYFGEIII